jgi:catechol 2,3-dioxygenase-like lactoylglutathione lyase family enzyme
MAKLPLSVHGIDHVVLKVSDVARSIAFYESMLGLRLERILDSVPVYQMRCGANLVDLVPLAAGEALPPREARGIEHLCLAVDAEFEPLLAALAAHGVPIASTPREVYGARGFGTSIYIRDPDDYEIELKLGYCATPVRQASASAAPTSPARSPADSA